MKLHVTLTDSEDGKEGDGKMRQDPLTSVCIECIDGGGGGGMDALGGWTGHCDARVSAEEGHKIVPPPASLMIIDKEITVVSTCIRSHFMGPEIG